MNLKIVRIFAAAVIVICVFATGVSAGVIIESVGIIRKQYAEIRDYAKTAEFMLAAGDGMSSDDVDTETLFKPFWESWDLLHEYFVDQPLDDNAMMEGAIRGMISALKDPHTRYATPSEYKDEVESSAGEYQGIGA